MASYRAKVQVPMNIAFVKYWGKSDGEVMVPLNDSFSTTIDALYAVSEVEIGNAKDDEVSVNGKKLDCGPGTRFRKVFDEFQRIVAKRGRDDLAEAKISVDSHTSFPVAAGLASSACGFAALALALGTIADLDNSQICRLARLGSGSACRSLFPGFVEWSALRTRVGDNDFVVQHSGERSDDFASSLTALVFHVRAEAKKIGSTVGMQRTALTSDLLKHRVRFVVPDHMLRIKRAVAAADFDEFAEVTMKESNSLHAVCLDTLPPISYLTATSHAIISAVHAINDAAGRVLAAYTFDAGPNAVVVVRTDDVEAFIAGFAEHCPSLHPHYDCRHPKCHKDIPVQPSPDGDVQDISVVVSSMGSGPKIL